jgi:hypothetical protein
MSSATSSIPKAALSLKPQCRLYGQTGKDAGTDTNKPARKMVSNMFCSLDGNDLAVGQFATERCSITQSTQHGDLVFCCFGGRIVKPIDATLDDLIIRASRAGGYQHKADQVVSVWTTPAASERRRPSERVDAKWPCKVQSHSFQPAIQSHSARPNICPKSVFYGTVLVQSLMAQGALSHHHEP